MISDTKKLMIRHFRKILHSAITLTRNVRRWWTWPTMLGRAGVLEDGRARSPSPVDTKHWPIVGIGRAHCSAQSLLPIFQTDR